MKFLPDFLTRAFSRQEKAVNIFDLIRNTTAFAQSAAGKVVTPATAVQVSTVFGICRVIGEGIAQSPCKLMQESEASKTRLPAKWHPLYDVLTIKPNSWQTAFEYFEMIGWHCVLAGRHFSYINRVRGQVVELIPFEPGQVTVKRDADYVLTYEVTGKNGSRMVFPQEAIWHVRGPSWDGWNSLEPVRLARDAVGLAMALEESAATLHKNGVAPSGVYSVEGTLKEDQHRLLTKWVEENYGGPENSGKPLILDRAAKWQSTQMTSVDAQSLENRRFQIEEICRFARVMPIMVGYSDKAATYASAEQMFLAHLVHTLAPWYSRLEQSISANLLTAEERKQGYYADFVEEALLRGSAEATMKVILGYVNGGLMTPNEGRAKLDMNPDQDESSNKLRIPQNIAGAPASEATV